MKPYQPIIALVLALAAPALAADEPTVFEIKQAFDPVQMQLDAGAQLSFVNADDVNHDMAVIAPGGDVVDHGVMKPGDSVMVPFAVAGVYTVICHVHPRMKMKVTVH
jgi:plastocyanin